MDASLLIHSSYNVRHGRATEFYTEKIFMPGTFESTKTDLIEMSIVFADVRTRVPGDVPGPRTRSGD